jgi:hypothetical protein
MALVKYNNNSISAVTSTGLATGSLVPIKTLTASSSATLSFVHGTDGVVLDSTYPIYQFEFINIHSANDNTQFSFNGSTDGGSNYNVVKTTTSFRAYHAETDDEQDLEYFGLMDLAQSTAFQRLADYTGDEADSGSSGSMTLYNPSSTTFVKHFVSRISANSLGYFEMDFNIAGYANTTSAINAVQFKMTSGNFDGKIKLYGIKDS